ncbi:MAG: TPM domain-containing protein [Bacteroidota bacterium]|jgi:uncharacterized membrane protein
MWSFFRKKPDDYFSPAEREEICQAITEAEKKTSGEIRVFIEGNCSQDNPLNRAQEVFAQLKMEATAARNGVLIYLAMNDHRLAVFGDEGIHARLGQDWWQQEVNTAIARFREHKFVPGLVNMIHDIGDALRTHFPYDEKGDSNELPNEIVLGD